MHVGRVTLAGSPLGGRSHTHAADCEALVHGAKTPQLWEPSDCGADWDQVALQEAARRQNPVPEPREPEDHGDTEPRAPSPQLSPPTRGGATLTQQTLRKLQ